jgi:hypothetical protein
MPIGSIQTIVKIQSYKFRCGANNGKIYQSAKIELEGRLFGKYDCLGLDRQTQASINIYVAFVEKEEDMSLTPFWNETEDKKYIGYIQSFQPSDSTGAIISNKRTVNFHIALPYNMFSKVCSFGEREFIFGTEHEEVIKPDEREKIDHIVGWVIGVDFGENLWWHKDNSKSKSWWKG